MSAGFENLLPLALLLFGNRGGSGGTAPGGGGAVPSGSTLANEVPRVRTGEASQLEWIKARYGQCLQILRDMNIPEATAHEMALSLLAQWAHETARGVSEFNYNLGGWRAWKGEPFFTARDAQTAGSPLFRWTAFPDLNTGMRKQIDRLIRVFPTAWALLLSEPTTSRFVEELGRKGYYGAKPSTYVQAWAMHRVEIARKLVLQ